jgi:ring-1,2-phenylacetyl-CoA epoxidase subunit PaaD
MKNEPVHTTTPEATEAVIWKLLESVTDPEVPVLSILDLGLVRSVQVSAADEIEIAITPTYSGCPALDAINMDIRLKLIENGFRNVHIQQQLSPAWTTDWMTESGKQKLKAFGIAPPNPKQQFCKTELFADEAVQCPRCDSYHTELISRFGSTACKSLHRCLACGEPFDHFKCH